MNKCQFCPNQAEYQHIIKLGSVKIAKQWLCKPCKQALKKEENE